MAERTEALAAGSESRLSSSAGEGVDASLTVTCPISVRLKHVAGSALLFAVWVWKVGERRGERAGGGRGAARAVASHLGKESTIEIVISAWS